MAHITVSLAVMFIAILALIGINTANPPMATNTAITLLLLGGLELFEAFNLET
jgi:hypothetical protein